MREDQLIVAHPALQLRPDPKQANASVFADIIRLTTAFVEGKSNQPIERHADALLVELRQAGPLRNGHAKLMLREPLVIKDLPLALANGDLDLARR